MNTTSTERRSEIPLEAVLPSFQSDARQRPPALRAVALNNTGNDYQSALLHAKKVAMYECAAKLQQLLVTWVLISDDQQARIFECLNTDPPEEQDLHAYYDKSTGQKLSLIPDGLIAAQTIDDYQIWLDWRGAAWNEGSTPFAAHELFDGIRGEIKRRFIRTIADRLQQACAKSAFDRLVLIAPTKMLSELHVHLDADVQDCIVSILPKEVRHY